MKINKENCNFPGIYVIKNLINNKIYVGKSKNCYKRLKQHLSQIKINSLDENYHLINDFKKYGEDNFDYYIVEKIEESDPLVIENLLYEKELYWMKELNSLNREFGYNLRWDSQGKCYVSEETSQKITNRLKKEWESGIRNDHSEKLKKYWENVSIERKNQQKEIMSKNKTKWIYIIYDPDGNLITDKGTYDTLKELKLNTSAFSAFSRQKTNEIITKKYKIIRINNKEIVHPEEKFSD